MRLIDADKLIEKCRKGWKLFGREDEKLKHWVDEDDIRNQPTVKAIPIEWLENWFSYNQWLGSSMSGEIRCSADSIIKAWEDENNLMQWAEESDVDLANRITRRFSPMENGKIPKVDAIPVIRCKDCKYREYGYCNLYLSFHRLTADMDYCSDAERKEE